MRKRDMWLWNPSLISPVIVYSTIGTLVLVAACYPFFGLQALYFLFMGLIAPFIGLIHGVVGKKVESLKESLATEEGIKAESLIVVGNIQAPGIAILTEDTLRLVPIIGDAQLIDRASIDSVRLVNFFNGKTLLWKKWLVLSLKPRLGFALPVSTAEEWYESLAATNKES